jgi:hypothetical protein
MNKLIQKEVNYDLYSNFLTHSFLSLLEQWCLYALSNGTDNELIYTRLSQNIKSFLFIMHTSKHSLILLDRQIFTHYIPYSYKSKSQILKYIYKDQPEGARCLHISKSHLTLRRIKMCYMQTISSFKKHHEYDKIAACNAAFIRLYLCIIYHHFPNLSELPSLFKANNAKDFYEQVEEYDTKILNSDPLADPT